MGTKRRKVPPKRITGPVPEWVPRVMAGDLVPALDGPEYEALVGWKYFDADIFGLERDERTRALVDGCLRRAIDAHQAT